MKADRQEVIVTMVFKPSESGDVADGVSVIESALIDGKSLYDRNDLLVISVKGKEDHD